MRCQETTPLTSPNSASPPPSAAQISLDPLPVWQPTVSDGSGFSLSSTPESSYSHGLGEYSAPNSCIAHARLFTVSRTLNVAFILCYNQCFIEFVFIMFEPPKIAESGWLNFLDYTPMTHSPQCLSLFLLQNLVSFNWKGMHNNRWLLLQGK